ncbi:hypothetical protein [Streptomyces sp. NPDC014734]|uniref:hypothetical protein n=1 Tax=Streptomyces sp. NPDC014734 TaxID=3364886 RepID=UPI0036FD673D
MSNKMLRSVLAVTFSAGLTFGVIGTLDLAWDSAPTGKATVRAQDMAPPDLAWDLVPTKGTDAQLTESDLAWDLVPAKTAGA